jgi:hypothetical protein
MLAVFARVLALGLALVALAGFVGAATVHAASLAGWNLVPAGRMWILHLGIALVFVPFVLTMLVDRVGVPGRTAPGAAVRPFGRLASLLLGVLLAYAIANFAWCIHLLDARGALSREGRPATTALRADDALTARMFSGHWLVFYFAPLAFFTRRVLPGPSRA